MDKKEKKAKYQIIEMNEKKFAKFAYSEGMKQQEDTAALTKEAMQLVDQKGLVVGIIMEKKITALFLFERIEDFFRNANAAAEDGAGWLSSVNTEKNQALLKETRRVSAIENESLYKKIVEDVLAEVKEKITYSVVCGLIFGDEIFYSEQLENPNASSFSLALPMAACGFVLGWLCFHSIAMGICFASSYFLIFSSAGAVKVKRGSIRQLGITAAGIDPDQIIGNETEESTDDDIE